MPGRMYDDLPGLKFERVRKLKSSSVWNPVLLHSEGMPAGDRPQRPSVDMLPSLPQETSAIWSLAREQKVSCRGCSVSVAGVEREPFADFVFGLNCPRSTGQQAKIAKMQLTMKQMEIGVQNCCTQNCSATNQSSSCHKTCNAVFIHEVTIQVCPKSRAQDSNLLQVQPQHTAEVFNLQRTSNLSFQIPFLYPRQASITHQTGNAVCHSAPAFGWSPGYKHVGTNFVSWTWELYRFLNGRKLEFNKRRLGSRPSLGIRPSYANVDLGFVVPEAVWDIQPNADLQELWPEWDVKVTLHTALLQGRKRLPGYSVSTGPTVTYEKLLAFP